MRIRKNREFSQLPGGEVHLCLLNQSPWDVNSISPDVDFDFQSSQFGSDSRFDTNANSNESVHSVDRMVNGEAESVERITAEKEDKVLGDNEEKGIENELEDSELKLGKNGDSGGDGDEKGVAGVRRSQRTAAKETRSLSSKSNGFYYYSEFGPLRGKKRLRGDEGNKISKAEGTGISENG